jgi:hypothetical protein
MGAFAALVPSLIVTSADELTIFVVFGNAATACAAVLSWRSQDVQWQLPVGLLGGIAVRVLVQAIFALTPGDHNLLPLDVPIYRAVTGVPIAIGVVGGRWLRRCRVPASPG